MSRVWWKRLKTSTHISVLRTDEAFHQLFTAAVKKCEEYQLDSFEVPRVRIPPSRYTGRAAEYRPDSTEKHYRKQYFEFIDVIVTGLSDRFDPDQSGLAQYLKLETMLISENIQNLIVLVCQFSWKCSSKRTRPNRCTRLNLRIEVWNMRCVYCFHKCWFF